MPTFPALTAIDASIKVPSGLVDVIATDRRDVSVTVRPMHPNREQDVRAVNETMVEFDGERLTVVAPKPRAAVFGPNESIEVCVEVPVGSRVTVDASCGNVTATGPLGATRVRARLGKIELDDTGDLWVRSSHGSVSVGNVAGSADVTCDHGNIRIGSVVGESVLKATHGSISVRETGAEVDANLSYGNLEIAHARSSIVAKTAHGSIEVHRAQAGTIDLETGFGSVTVGVREGVPAWLDVAARTGRVRNELDAIAAPESAAATVSVLARTRAGNIRIHRAA